MKYTKGKFVTTYMHKELEHEGYVCHPFGIYKIGQGWSLAHIPEKKDVWRGSYKTLKEAKERLNQALKVIPLEAWQREDTHPFDGYSIDQIKDLRKVLS